MMSKPMKIRKGGKHLDYLAATEYFVTAADKEKNLTRWQGKAAKALGLDGKEVTVADFENILHHRDAKGNPLTQNANNKNLETLGYDLINTPCKSASMIFAFAEPWLRDEIFKAFEEANAESMSYVEKSLYIRSGKGGTKNEPAEGVTIASFAHMCSRALDPNPHFHNALAAAAMRQDGTFGSIEGSTVMEIRKTAGAVFDAGVALRLNKLGFQISADERSDFAFRVDGFTDADETEFSQSRSKILKWLKKYNLSPSDAIACERAAKAARDDKNEPKFRDLLTLWKARGASKGITAQTVEKMRTGITQDAATAIDPEQVLAKLTEQKSVFERKDLLQAVAIEAARNGGMSLADIEKIVDQMLNNGVTHSLGEHVRKSDVITNKIRQAEAVRLGQFEPKIKNKSRPPTALKARSMFTTKETYDTEVGLALEFDAAVKDTRHNRTNEQVESAIKKYEAQKSEELGFAVTMKPEQIECLKHHASGGRQSGTDGYSGTGKSFVMGAVRLLEEDAGQRVIATSLSGMAAAGLKEGAGIEEGGTLASLIMQAEQGKITFDEKTTIIVDEVGTVGAKQFRKLQKLAPESKIIILGDKDQYQNIEAGAFMAGLQTLGFKFATLSDIERQKIDWMKNAVLNFKDGRGAEALSAFQSHGLITMKDSTEATLKAMALEYANNDAAEFDKAMMTSTHADSRIVNDEVRRLKIERDQLGSEGTFVEFTSKDGNASYMREIRTGDRLRFKKNAKLLGIFNGELATVEKITAMKSGDTELTLKHDNGSTVKFRLSEYSQLDYGYCGTGMSHQGVSKKYAYAFFDADTVNKQAAYVLASRSKQETKIFMTTADSEDAADALSNLGRAVSRDGSKDWVLDYLTQDQWKKFTAPQTIQNPSSMENETTSPAELKPIIHRKQQSISGTPAARRNRL